MGVLEKTRRSGSQDVMDLDFYIIVTVIYQKTCDFYKLFYSLEQARISGVGGIAEI